MINDFAIYIPAYNAALTLPRVLTRIPPEIKGSVAEILVVDNASPDNTHLVAMQCKESQGIFNLSVIRNPENKGYGGSQKIAYQYCIDKNYKGVAMLHGDAQYAPELLWDLFQPILKGEADMVFGSRMSGDPRAGGMPLIRYLGNRFLTGLQNLILGTKLSEFHSGYRIYSVDALKKIPFQRLSSDYHFDTEIIILLIQKKLRIAEVPIPTHYGDEKNYVNIWKYGIQVLVTTATYFLYSHRFYKKSKWRKILG
jgi:glycosyltransferase involved in cell wall biosynthesis